jgi:lipid A ethanolaminephosphotransferase
VIDSMDAEGRVIPALFYVSDHGESLGENGIYLHGAPYFMAPPEQTEVPMVIWMSERFRDSLGLDQACMAKAAGDAVSHDNMFSTILGMADVATTARDPALDLAGACRKAGG